MDIQEWSKSTNTWLQRASLVSFVPLAKNGEKNYSGFTHDILNCAERVVRNPERFAQTCNGWLLRELWLANNSYVEDFIERNIMYFSSEGLRYSYEKMPDEKKKYFQKMRKDVKKKEKINL